MCVCVCVCVCVCANDDWGVVHVLVCVRASVIWAAPLQCMFVCMYMAWAAVHVHVSACDAWATVHGCVCVCACTLSIHMCFILPHSSLPISHLSNNKKCLMSLTGPVKAPRPPRQCPHQPHEGYQGGGLRLGCSLCFPAGWVGKRDLHARLGDEEGHG